MSNNTSEFQISEARSLKVILCNTKDLGNPSEIRLPNSDVKESIEITFKNSSYLCFDDDIKGITSEFENDITHGIKLPYFNQKTKANDKSVGETITLENKDTINRKFTFASDDVLKNDENLERELKTFSFARCILLCDPVNKAKDQMKEICDDLLYKLELGMTEEDVAKCYSKMIEINKKRFKIICILFSFECYDESASIVKCIRNYEDANCLQPSFILALVEEYSKSLIAQALNDCKSSKGESRSMFSGIISNNNDFDDGLSLFNTLKSKMELMQIDGVENLPIAKDKINMYITHKM